MYDKCEIDVAGFNDYLSKTKSFVKNEKIKKK